MSNDEPRPLYWVRVVNPDAQDYDRVGMFIKRLEDVVCPYVVDFNDGCEPTAFAKDEIERIYAS